ncbi:MAG: HTH domain-containing protein [Candidatus Cyclobacteriaceae bacterium M3_2C_046]
MDYFTYRQKLELLIYLIQKNRAGTPKEFSEKLEVSERTVLRMIQFLKNSGYEIKFVRTINKYIMKN